MLESSRLSGALFLVVSGLLLTLQLSAQSCDTPESLCPADTPAALSYEDGADSGVGPGFCFGDAPNAVFYSFQTQNTNDFPSIDYSDSTATLFFNVDSCLADTLLGLAVFSAPDPCDPGTFSDPLVCDVDSLGGGAYQLEGLEPSTTYYVMVSGLANVQGTDTAECFFDISVAGPALEYDLQVDAFPQADPDRSDIFESETLVLTASDDFGTIQWAGPQLNNVEGSEVTADPEGVDITVTYTATAEIDGCIYVDEIDVYISPAIFPSNAFSPNGDGINDTWEILNIDEWPNAQIFVYSRWGNKVFQATNYSNDWGGDDLPAATYYFVIELNPIDFNADPITGSVTIMR